MWIPIVLSLLVAWGLASVVLALVVGRMIRGPERTPVPGAPSTHLRDRGLAGWHLPRAS